MYVIFTATSIKLSCKFFYYPFYIVVYDFSYYMGQKTGKSRHPCHLHTLTHGFKHMKLN
jgi:hypothetical protein